MPTLRTYSAPDIPRWRCFFCAEIVWLGANSGRVRNDTDGPGIHDPAHSCSGYDNGRLRPGMSYQTIPRYLSADELQAARQLHRQVSITNITWDGAVEGPDIPFEDEDREENVPGNVDAWWTTITLPRPFLWNSFPAGQNSLGLISVQGDHVDYPHLIELLKEFAAENDLVVRPQVQMNFWVEADRSGDRELISVQRPHSFYIGRELPDAPFTFEAPNEWAEEFTCPHCSETHLAYTASCNGLGFCCSFCRASAIEDGAELVDVGFNTACNSCAHSCEIDGCEAWVVGEDRHYCEDHRVDTYCVFCDTYMERNVEDEPFFQPQGGGQCCEDCRELCCENCRVYNRRGLTWNSDLEMNVCRRCLLVGPDGETGESFDEDADMTNKAMQIPTIPGRENVRQCGIEIEGANGEGGGNDLALALYEAQLSVYDRMGGYHSGSEGGFSHVERDSSVDWEVVIGPLNPANQTHIRNLNSVIRIIRENVKSGRVGLDLRAGCHIHVEAARTSLTGAFNLNTLFSYLEDVIFRIGAARWPVHRAIMDTHYTAPIPKDLRKLQFAREHTQSEDARYYALSFQNYFNRVLNNCHCGAVRYDSWEECECDLGKCTFEFRVFNTTANPRKLHAYMALSQALVAKAMSLGDLDNTREQFPAMEFRARRFKDMPETEQEEITGVWRDRLAWMFNELPLTDAEKESLAYCIRHSELEQVGEDFIRSLLPEQQVIEEAIA